MRKTTLKYSHDMEMRLQTDRTSALGLDIDGVITSSPGYFSSLSNRWRRDGGLVHVVSSRSDNPEARKATIDELRDIGIEYDYLYLLESIDVAQQQCPHGGLDWYQKFIWQKVDYCLKHGINNFYDDESKVVDLFKLYAPEIEIIYWSC